MDHLAILDKKRKLLNKIISGEKTIESRWYKFKRDPWNKIKKGDLVYFKDSGEPVTVRAEVERVIEFKDLNLEKIKEIITRYGTKIGFKITNFDYSKYTDKKYCILIFIKNVREIEPFEIDKCGFGMMSAWICVEDIRKIKK